MSVLGALTAGSLLAQVGARKTAASRRQVQPKCGPLTRPDCGPLTRSPVWSVHPTWVWFIARPVTLILDNFLRDPLTAAQTRDLADILDDRYGRRATLVATQMPVEDWHARLGDPALADAILDRLVHNAHRLNLAGDSLRKAAGKRTAT